MMKRPVLVTVLARLGRSIEPPRTAVVKLLMRSRSRRGTVVTLVAVGAFVMTATPAFGEPAATAVSPGNVAFVFTGAPEDWTVPASLYSIVAEVCGASGQNMLVGGSTVKFAGRPGSGGCVTATVSVTPGEVIRIRVGGTSSSGGWPDGGTSRCFDVTCGGSGGGSSDIRLGGDALTNRVLVGGGGGGGGGDSLGGAGGDAGGGASTDGFDGADGGTGAGLPDNPNHPRGGTGGTLVQQTRGCGVSNRVLFPVPQCVTGAQPLWAYPPGEAGSGNVGADSVIVLDGATGGAGGGGYFGGGSGCAWNSDYDGAGSSLGTCGGGGGSSYADPTRTVDHFLSQGTANWYDEWLADRDSPGDAGSVTLSWPAPGELPPTGSGLGAVPLALAALAVGASLMVVVRRRSC